MPKRRWGSPAQLKAQRTASLASARSRRRIATLTRGRSEPKRRMPQTKSQAGGRKLRSGMGPSGDNTAVKLSHAPVAVSGPRRKPDAPKLRNDNPEHKRNVRVYQSKVYLPTKSDVRHVNKQLRRQSVHLWLGDRALKVYDKLNPS